jgi:hypothetical protein
MGQSLNDQIISDYKALVEPYTARGRQDIANSGLAHLIATYGAQNVRSALAQHVANYTALGL